MIATTDVANILYKDCKAFGITAYQKGNIPKGEAKAERIVILTKSQTSETYWKKGYVEVNLCVPDQRDGMADLVRLQELERQAVEVFNDEGGNGIVGTYDDTPYYYMIESIGTEADVDLKCHYVNVRIMFEVLNVN